MRSAPTARLAARAACGFATFALIAGCGGSGSTTTHSSPQPTASSSGSGGSRPTVFAAASLTKVLPTIDPNPRYTFGGSDALQMQIQQGAPADVFAAASPKQPAALYAKKLVDRPVEFATNRLVLIVPKSNPARITSVNDVTKPGVKLVICQAAVPCGDYARKAFANLGITSAAMKRVVSQTTDVTQTVAQVATGQADAGFVYITDAQAAGARVRTIELPPKAKPNTKDYIAVVKSGKNQSAAQAFVKKVLSPRGQAKLQAAGFGKP